MKYLYPHHIYIAIVIRHCSPLLFFLLILSHNVGAFHEVTNVHGTLDIVVNNAGISSKDYRKTAEVDLVRSCKSTGPISFNWTTPIKQVQLGMKFVIVSTGEQKY